MTIKLLLRTSNIVVLLSYSASVTTQMYFRCDHLHFFFILSNLHVSFSHPLRLPLCREFPRGGEPAGRRVGSGKKGGVGGGAQDHLWPKKKARPLGRKASLTATLPRLAKSLSPLLLSLVAGVAASAMFTKRRLHADVFELAKNEGKLMLNWREEEEICFHMLNNAYVYNFILSVMQSSYKSIIQ